MFCPRCGAENGSAQAFCRRCGLSLHAVRLASEGRVEDALARLKKGSGNLSGGALILIIALLNALANGYFAAWQSALISVLAGSAVGVPLIAAGMVRVGRAKRLLNPEDEPKTLAGGDPKPSLPEASAATTSGMESETSHEASARDSVTEHTTLRLNPPGPPGRE